MSNKHDAERHFPNEEELRILIPKLHEYFGYEERSIQRKKCCAEAYEAVRGFNEQHWTQGKVRLWFNNNKNNYLSVDVKRIPTPHITPLDVKDPNLEEAPISSEPKPKPEGVVLEIVPEAFPETDESDDEIPGVPQATEEATVDHMKYAYFKTLDKMYRAIRNIGELQDEEEKRKQQIVAEERFKEILDGMKKLGLTIVSNDQSAIRIVARMTKQMIRQVSRTTRSYSHNESARDADVPVRMEETCPNVFVPARTQNRVGKGDPTVAAFYKGYSTQKEDVLPGCTCCDYVNGMLIYSHLNGRDHFYGLIIDGDEIPTGFFRQATSMVYDAERNAIWLAADCRVKGFSLETKKCIATLFAGTAVVLSSYLLLWKKQVVMATDKRILIWDGSFENIPTTECKNSENEQIAASQLLSLDHIEWTRGKVARSLPSPLPADAPITCGCAVGDYLALGSDEHHAIYLLNDQGQTVARLLGHTGGVTSMCPVSDTKFLSGSEDQTVKMWNVEKQYSEMQFQRHTSAVISISYGMYLDRCFMFSAGRDDVVRGWDVDGRTSIFEVHTAPRKPKCVRFAPEMRKLFVLSQEDAPNMYEMKPYVSQVFTFTEPQEDK